MAKNTNRKRGKNRNPEARDQLYDDFLSMFGETVDPIKIFNVLESNKWNVDTSVDELMNIAEMKSNRQEMQPYKEANHQAIPPWPNRPSQNRTSDFQAPFSGRDSFVKPNVNQHNGFDNIKVVYKGDRSEDEADADIIIEEECYVDSCEEFCDVPFQKNLIKAKSSAHLPVKSPGTCVSQRKIADIVTIYRDCLTIVDTSERIIQIVLNSIKVIVMLRGCPGSGKSYTAEKIILNLNRINPKLKLKSKDHILSTDDYFITKRGYEFNGSDLTAAHEWNRKRALKAVTKHVNPLIIDNTNTQLWEMTPYVQLGVDFGYAVQVLEPESAWKFNENENFRRNVHRVPRNKIRNMLQRYEHHINSSNILQLLKLHYRPSNEPPQIVPSAERKSEENLHQGIRRNDFADMTPSCRSFFEKSLLSSAVVVDSATSATNDSSQTSSSMRNDKANKQRNNSSNEHSKHNNLNGIFSSSESSNDYMMKDRDVLETFKTPSVPRNWFPIHKSSIVDGSTSNSENIYKNSFNYGSSDNSKHVNASFDNNKIEIQNYCNYNLKNQSDSLLHVTSDEIQEECTANTFLSSILKNVNLLSDKTKDNNNSSNQDERGNFKEFSPTCSTNTTDRPPYYFQNIDLLSCIRDDDTLPDVQRNVDYPEMPEMLSELTVQSINIHKSENGNKKDEKIEEPETGYFSAPIDSSNKSIDDSANSSKKSSINSFFESFLGTREEKYQESPGNSINHGIDSDISNQESILKKGVDAVINSGVPSPNIKEDLMNLEAFYQVSPSKREEIDEITETYDEASFLKKEVNGDINNGEFSSNKIILNSVSCNQESVNEKEVLNSETCIEEKYQESPGNSMNRGTNLEISNQESFLEKGVDAVINSETFTVSSPNIQEDILNLEACNQVSPSKREEIYKIIAESFDEASLLKEEIDAGINNQEYSSNKVNNELNSESSDQESFIERDVINSETCIKNSSSVLEESHRILPVASEIVTEVSNQQSPLSRIEKDNKDTFCVTPSKSGECHEQDSDIVSVNVENEIASDNSTSKGEVNSEMALFKFKPTEQSIDNSCISHKRNLTKKKISSSNNAKSNSFSVKKKNTMKDLFFSELKDDPVDDYFNDAEISALLKSFEELDLTCVHCGGCPSCNPNCGEVCTAALKAPGQASGPQVLDKNCFCHPISQSTEDTEPNDSNRKSETPEKSDELNSSMSGKVLSDSFVSVAEDSNSDSVYYDTRGNDDDIDEDQDCQAVNVANVDEDQDTKAVNVADCDEDTKEAKDDGIDKDETIKRESDDNTDKNTKEAKNDDIHKDQYKRGAIDDDFDIDQAPKEANSNDIDQNSKGAKDCDIDEHENTNGANMDDTDEVKDINEFMKMEKDNSSEDSIIECGQTAESAASVFPLLETNNEVESSDLSLDVIRSRIKEGARVKTFDVMTWLQSNCIKEIENDLNTIENTILFDGEVLAPEKKNSDVLYCEKNTDDLVKNTNSELSSDNPSEKSDISFNDSTRNPENRSSDIYNDSTTKSSVISNDSPSKSSVMSNDSQSENSEISNDSPNIINLAPKPSRGLERTKIASPDSYKDSSTSTVKSKRCNKFLKWDSVEEPESSWAEKMKSALGTGEGEISFGPQPKREKYGVNSDQKVESSEDESEAKQYTATKMIDILSKSDEDVNEEENEEPQQKKEEEEDDSFNEKLKILQNLFPDSKHCYLEELLKQCQGDIDWAAELLLEGGSAETYSVERKNSVEMFPLLKKSSDEEKCQPSCSKKQKKKEKKNGNTSKEAHMELKKIIEQNVVLNESSYSDHLLKLLKFRRGESPPELFEISDDNNFINPEFSQNFGPEFSQNFGPELNQNFGPEYNQNFGPEFNQNLSPEFNQNFGPEFIQNFGPESVHPASGDHTTLEEQAREGELFETEHAERSTEDEETLEFVFNKDVIVTLSNNFGCAGFPLDMTDVSCPVKLPMRLARELHSYWMDSVEEFLGSEHSRMQMMIKEDEELAKRLQEEEACAVSSGAAHHSDERPFTPKLQEVIDMETALTLHEAELKKIREETHVNESTTAAKLAKSVLLDTFPNEKEEILCDLLRANNYSLHDTVSLVNMLLENDQPDQNTKVNQNKQPEDDIDDYSSPFENAAALQKDWEESRDEAKQFFLLRNEYFQKAQSAYTSGNKAAASFYSQVANMYMKKMEDANCKAATLLLSSNHSQKHTLDLHFYQVKEALQVLDLFLDASMTRLQESKKQKCLIFIITGRGLHSVNGKSIIKPVVMKRLAQRKIRFQVDESNPGMLRCTLTKYS